MCFAYVCLWHGMWRNVVLWVSANFVGVTLEAFGDRMSGSPRLRRFEASSASARIVLLNYMS